MKRFLLLVAVVVLVGAASYALTRLIAPKPPVDEDQISWLTREFKLTSAQAAAIEKIHLDYIPICSDHCAAIVDARERLAHAPDDAQLRAEVARLEQVCQTATLEHVREVAAQMNPGQAQRFLSLVEPRILRHDHQVAFGLK
jgi:Tfp pilus assembly protein PilN